MSYTLKIDSSSGGVPVAGGKGKVLKKKTAADYDTEWGDQVPVGGAKGDVLKKKTAADYDVEWGAAAGGGGGDLFDRFLAMGGFPPSANFATLDVRNDRPVLVFDKATIESIYYESIMNPAWDGAADIRVSLWFMAPLAIAGDVKWGAAFEPQPTTLDLDTDAFETEKTAVGTVSATAGKLTKVDMDFAVADVGALAVDTPYRLRVRRIANDAADTLDEDAQLFKVEIRKKP